MHKTGSSSIQETLGNSRDILRKHNIWYPSMDEYNHTVNFTPIFSNDPLKDITFIMKEITNIQQAKKEQNSLKKVWINEFKKIDCENVIMSAEGCSMLLEPRVREMKEFLDQYFDEILIIMYVREPKSFYVSSIQQMLKHMDNSFEDFTFKKPNQLYTRRLPGFVNVFGKENIIIRPFNREVFKNGDLIDDFCESASLDIDTTNIPRIKTNESLGYNTTVLLSEYNKRYPGFIDGRYNNNRGLSRNVGKVLEIFNKVDRKKLELDFHFSKEDTEYINKEIKYINQFLEYNYRFTDLIASNSPNKFPTIKDIDSEYLIEVINEYNKEIEQLLNQRSIISKAKDITKKNIVNYLKKKDENSSFGVEYVSGWHELEDNGASWSGPGKESTILITAEKKRLDLILFFRIEHYIIEDVIDSLKIYVNNNSVNYLKTDDSNKYVIMINNNMFNKENQLEIKYTVNNTYSPKELGEGGDIRKLGFVLSGLFIEEI
jgi:hypothetical protein